MAEINFGTFLKVVVLFGAFGLAGCGSAGKRRGSETPGGAAGTRQCGAFCRELDRCLGSEFKDSLKTEMCDLARCESGCRAEVRSAAGHEGAY